MKQIYISIFLLIFAVTANAQDNLAKESKQKMQDFLQKFSSPKQLKSAATEAYALDSITFENGAFKEMTYNDNGLLLTYKYYKNEGGTINLFETETNTYNESGQMLTNVVASYDDWANKLTDQWKIENTYTSQGRPLTEIEWVVGDEAPYELEYQSKTTYTFPEDKALEAMVYDWDNDQWNLEEKQMIFGSWGTGTLPMVDSLYLETLVEGTSDEWFRVAKMFFAYSGDGLMAETLSIIYDEDTGAELVKLKDKITYNAIGYTLMETTEIYNPDSMDWDLPSKVEYEYNDDNQIIREEEFNSGWTGILAPSSRIIYDYDSDGNLETQKDYLYSGGEELTLFYKDEFSFKNLDTENIMLPSSDIGYFGGLNDFFDEEFYENGAIDEVKHYSYWYSESVPNEELEKTGKYHYSKYGSVPTSVEQENNASIKVFPNPFTNEIKLQLEKAGDYQLKIRNSIGQVVYSKNINGTTTSHNVSGLPGGFYILSVLLDGENTTNYKLVKE